MEQIKTIVSSLTEDETVLEKLCTRMETLFSHLDPDAIGADYRAALEAGDAAAAVKACAAYYRRKNVVLTKERSADGPYSKDEADRAVRGQMCEIGVPWDFPDGKVDFQFDPTLVKGPRNHEWVWQFNRHGFWLEMARAYYDTRDEAYAKAFNEQMAHWLTQVIDIPANWNGPGSAWRTIECGIRLYATWPAAFEAFRLSPSVDDCVLLLMIESMHRQAELMIEHPTGANWLVIETDGVYTFSSAFTEFRDAKEYRRIGGERILAEMQRQVLPDGMQYELAADYHAGVFNDFADIYETAVLYGHEAEFPAAYTDGLIRMAEAGVRMSTPAMTQPRTNDTWTIATTHMTRRAARYAPDNKHFLYINSARREGEPPAGETASVFMPYAGFCIMRSDWTEHALYLNFDVGPTGRAHIHQDKLNINLFCGKDELIFDDGGGQYEISAARTYGISAYDHNTVLVDGLGQNRSEPKQVTEPIDAHWITNAVFDYACGVYEDGFGPDQIRSARHKREVRFCKPDFFAVVDTLTASDEGEHTYEILFHLDTTHVDILENGIARSAFGGDSEVLIVPVGDRTAEKETETVSGQTEPFLRGWFIGRNDNNQHPASTVSRMTFPVKDHRFATLLFPIRKGDSMPEITEINDRIRVSFRGKTTEFSLDNLSDKLSSDAQ